MAISRRKARNISVDGASFRWAVSQDSGYSVVVVQSASGHGCKLEVIVPWPDRLTPHGAHVSGPDAVTPSEIAAMIRAAKGLGWQPASNERSTFPVTRRADMTLAVRGRP